MVDILLPETAINMLPFSAEPLLHWKGKTDIRRFIDVLYANSIYPPFSSYLYKRGQKDIRVWSKQFQNGAQEPLKADVKPHIKEHIVAQAATIPNFLENPRFGKAAKYVVAWKSCIQSLLEESGFYSLAHILEADEEIGCSLLLASHLYYKQAMQVLRNYIEEIILPINFCDNVDEFNQWKANNYRIPPLRGREGLVKKLVDKRILSEKIGKLVSDLYGDLNSYIHGSENKLIHKGIYTGSRDGLIFKPGDFEVWCDYLSRTLDVGIRLLRVNYVQWEKISSAKWQSLREQGKLFCSVCHNEGDFEIDHISQVKLEATLLPDRTWAKSSDSDSNRDLITYVCRQCGSTISILSEPIDALKPDAD